MSGARGGATTPAQSHGSATAPAAQMRSTRSGAPGAAPPVTTAASARPATQAPLITSSFGADGRGHVGVHSTGNSPSTPRANVANASPAGAGTPSASSSSAASLSVALAAAAASSSASLFNLRDLFDTVRVMAAGRVFTGYFANPALSEPIKQDLFVFFDVATPRPTQQQQQQQSAAATSAASRTVAPSMQLGGALYWTVVGRDGSLHRARAADLSLPLSEIDDIYLGKRTAALSLPLAAAAREDCCFSLIAKNRTHMNFEARSPVSLVSWLLGLKRLVQANKKLVETPPQQPQPQPSGATLDIHDTNQSGLRGDIWQAMLSGIQAGVQLFASGAVGTPSAASPPTGPASQGQTTTPQKGSPATQTSAQQPSSSSSSPTTSAATAAAASNHSNFLSNLLKRPTGSSPQAAQPLQQQPLAQRPDANSNTSSHALRSSNSSGGQLSLSSPSDSSVDPLLVFEILGRIGQGSSGYVYKARDSRDDQLVAIKILEVDGASSTRDLQAEIDILRQCHSPNIVAYKGTFTRGAAPPSSSSASGYHPAGLHVPQQIWIVMEFCLAEDHQVLTDRGFLGLEEVQRAWIEQQEQEDRPDAATPPLRFASLNPATHALEYHPATAFVHYPAGQKPMIELSDADCDWDEASSVRCNRATRSGVSLLVTPQHDLFVRRCDSPNAVSDDVAWQPVPPASPNQFSKVKAGEVVTDDPRSRLQLLAHAPAGFQPSDSSALAPLFNLLPSSDQQRSFLQLFGHWLVSHGSAQLTSDAMLFNARDDAEFCWLRPTLQALPLASGEFVSHEPLGDGSWRLFLCSRSWRGWFLSSPPSAPPTSSRCGSGAACHMPAWVWQLSRDAMRVLLDAMKCASSAQPQAAEGSHVSMALHAACVPFRDGLVRMAMHAGYAAHFVAAHVSSPPSSTPPSHWVVYLRSAPEFATPMLQPHRDVRATQSYTGRTWCVTVPPHNLLVVRRVAVDASSGTVTRASAPVLVGNCMGGSLSDLMAITDRVLSETQAAAVLRMTLHGLAYFHSLRQVHRDIKAANLLLHQDGLVKLSDFGVSARLTPSLSKRRTTVGSPYWMAPEVLTSTSQSDSYNEKADIYSLGCTALELVTGNPPYHDIHPMKALFAIPQLPPPRLPRTLADGTPCEWSPEFEEFVALCLQKDLQQRPSAAQLLTHPFIARAAGAPLLKRLLADCIPDIEKYREIEARMASKVAFGGSRRTRFDDSDSETSVSYSRSSLSLSRSADYTLRSAASWSDVRQLASSGANARGLPSSSLDARVASWERELSRSERDRERARREREWDAELSYKREVEYSQRSASPSLSTSSIGGGGAYWSNWERERERQHNSSFSIGTPPQQRMRPCADASCSHETHECESANGGAEEDQSPSLNTLYRRVARGMRGAELFVSPPSSQSVREEDEQLHAAGQPIAIAPPHLLPPPANLQRPRQSNDAHARTPTHDPPPLSFPPHAYEQSESASHPGASVARPVARTPNAVAASTPVLQEARSIFQGGVSHDGTPRAAAAAAAATNGGSTGSNSSSGAWLDIGPTAASAVISATAAAAATTPRQLAQAAQHLTLEQGQQQAQSHQQRTTPPNPAHK